MGANQKRRVKALDPNSEVDAMEACNGVEKSRKRSARKQFQKATGKIDKVDHSSPPCKSEVMPLTVEPKTTSFVQESTKLPVLDINTGKTVHPPEKIKLQLFPIDEVTRLGLEKDGFHPYLELTLSARKKISSVIKHFNSKWGSSCIAVGEPMLFSYHIAENLASYRWTRDDIQTSARDVHLTIGSPALFRLRYGWISDPETKSLGQPEESEQPIMTSEETKVVVDDKMPSNGAVDSMGNEVRMDSGTGQSLALWADSLTNISIGGLLSEASLQGCLANSDPKSNGSNAGLLSSQLISDSFDAFLAGQINPSQNPRPPLQDSHSSILDAEDTCHAFSFQKLPSVRKDAIASSGSVYPHASSQDTTYKSFKQPNANEANILSQDQACQQSDTDLLLCSRVYNDESSLGLSGIKWTESLGPFDLGLSSSHKIISCNGDYITNGVK